MYSYSSLIKIKTRRIYRIPSGSAVRVVKVDEDRDFVIVHNYHTHSREAFSYREASKIFTPLFTIREVSKVLGKKSSTLRKYEGLGLIPEATKISLNAEGKKTTRVYTAQDIEDLVLFFQRRRPVGRPGPIGVSSFNRSAVDKKFATVLKKDRRNG